jgi:2-keto-4-pentenoate hydratase/2-oxohepta-3-ene-1,7-dioic acid hydratase in catechol pathway
MRFATSSDEHGTFAVALDPARGTVRLAAADAGALVHLDAEALAALVADGRPVDGDVALHAPLIPPKIVAIGLNYLDHVRETGMAAPERPLVFTKFSTSVVGPDAAIVVDPALTSRVDWEVELGVVIGTVARNVPAERALDHVFGYTVANDVSARDVQFGDGQWVRGKSLDTFCPLGPAVVTADEVADPQALRLWTRVNGETMQDSTTAEMVFGIAELIAFCSASFTLLPGDVLLTGTPWGCGEFMTPQRHLRPGDVVECEVEGLGVLRNPVAAP